MPLYDTATKEEIASEDIENSDYIKAAKRKMAKATFDKMVRTIDTALDQLQPSKSNALIWTKTGALLGPNSTQPIRDINHLWEKSNEVYDGVTLLKFIGTMLMWRISMRSDDIWLVHRFDTGKIDPVTNKLIKINQYWIDNNFQPVKPPSAADLIAKFNRKN